MADGPCLVTSRSAMEPHRYYGLQEAEVVKASARATFRITARTKHSEGRAQPPAMSMVLLPIGMYWVAATHVGWS